MAETLEKISMACFVMSGVEAMLAVFFWFRFQIPVVFRDLSGHIEKHTKKKDAFTMLEEVILIHTDEVIQ